MYCENCGSDVRGNFCLNCGYKVMNQQQTQPLTQPPQNYYQAPQQRNPNLKNIKLWILFIFTLITLFLVISSIFLPWYFVRIDIDEVENIEIDGQMDMEDKLGERDEYFEAEYLGETEKDTEHMTNDELKHDYPDTANCKSITLALMEILFILLIIVIIGIIIFFVKPLKSFKLLSIFIMIILIFSILTISYFTLVYGPYEGDSDSDEEEYDVDYDTSGNWFYQEAEFSGDIEGEGEAGVGIGYILSIIVIIFLIISFVFNVLLFKESTQLYPIQPTQQPPPQLPLPPYQQPPPLPPQPPYQQPPPLPPQPPLPQYQQPPPYPPYQQPPQQPI